MKQLPGNENARWNKELVRELAYIKQHLRYKPKISKLLPAIFSGIFLLLLVVTVATSAYYKISNGKELSALAIAMFSIIVANFIASMVRYMQSLKFISIPTGLYLSDSVATLQSFLHHHKFAFTRHPEMPEVFQIMSRNISAGKEDREIVLFVADDNRILMNSHFTNSLSFFPVPAAP